MTPKRPCDIAETILCIARERGWPGYELLTSRRRWVDETAYIASPTKRIAHPDHLRIVAMGKGMTRLLLEQAALREDDWFAALRNAGMSGW